MKFNLKKTYSPYAELFSGIITIILAVFLFVNHEFVWSQIKLITIILLVIYTITNIIQFDPKMNKLNISISLNVIITSFSIGYIHFFPNGFISLFPFVVGIYIFAQAITRFIKFIVFMIDKLKYRYLILFEAIVTLLFSLRLILKPLHNIQLLSLYIGIYLLFYGLVDIIKAMNKLLLSADAHYAMPVPIIVAALLPKNTLENIDEMIKEEPEDKDSDLEIFIYLREGGFGQFGHMDFSYKNKTYSYGCFDPHTQKLWGGFGDGVLIVCDRDKFLKHGNVFKQATIIKYGLALNEKQKELIESRIDSLMNRTTPLYSDAEISEKEGTNIKYDNYLSNLYLNTHAKSYKFTEGRFKTYFVLSTNCVNVAAEVLQMKGLDLLNIKGILTPGTYLSYLNDEYISGSSIVVNRFVYQK